MPEKNKIIICDTTLRDGAQGEGVFFSSAAKVHLARKLDDFGIAVEVIDPGAGKHEVKEEYGIDLKESPSGKYDAVILAVAHKQYMNLDESFFSPLLSKDGIVVDVKGILRGKIQKHTYWSL